VAPPEVALNSNNMANIALGAGIAVWVLQVVGFCLSIIPFVGILVTLLVWVLDVAAVVCGFMGYQQSKVSGVGGGAAIGGLVLGGLNVLMQVTLIAFGVCAGMGLVVLSILGNN
jgi:hypothetical protein